MMSIRHIAAMCLALVAVLVASCGGGDGISGTGAAAGSLRVAMTDAPSCGFDAVNVTVQKVRVHQSASALDGDAGWADIVIAPALRADLLTLRNGVLAELGQVALPAGHYTQLRLVLVANGNSAPWANSVVLAGGVAETPLDTPSAPQSGIKLNVNIDVPAHQRVDVVLDFNACQSVVKRGNTGRYNLKPVISVIPLLSDAGMRIVGFVDPLLAAGVTEVSAQQAGVPIKATRPDAITGQFILYPVPTGTYDLVVSAAGRATAVVTDVPVITTAYTHVNTASSPILPPVAALPRQVSGTLAPATGTVRALQRFAGNSGPTIEAAWGSVDATSGAFTFTLPVDAPVKTAYVANPTSLSFVADATAAGQYTIEAASSGLLQTRSIDATVPVPPVNFVFP
jgi:Domain of unknown function (DUF4382)